MIQQILKDAIDKLNALNLKEKRRDKDTWMIIVIRNDIVALKLAHEDYERGSK